MTGQKLTISVFQLYLNLKRGPPKNHATSPSTSIKFGSIFSLTSPCLHTQQCLSRITILSFVRGIFKKCEEKELPEIIQSLCLTDSRNTANRKQLIFLEQIFYIDTDNRIQIPEMCHVVKLCTNDTQQDLLRIKPDLQQARAIQCWRPELGLDKQLPIWPSHRQTLFSVAANPVF